MSLPILKKLIILKSLFWSVACFANQEFTFKPRSKIEAQIGVSSLNRVEVQGGDLMEVIGDEGKYSLYWSSDWRNLFIKPKVAVGETLDLSLIFFGGLAQDVRFTVGDTTAKTVTINVGSDNYKYIPHHDFRQLSDYHWRGTRLQQEVAAMMRAMFEDEPRAEDKPRAESVKGKYYVTNTKRLLKITQKLQISQTKAYKYKNLTGAVLSVKNNSKTPVMISEEDFSRLFKAILAINLESSTVLPRSSTSVFIVTSEVSDAK